MHKFNESVSVMSTPSTIEFWTGAVRPSRAATIGFSEIESLRFLEDDEHFERPEIGTSREVIPLYRAVGLLGTSRKSSRRLNDWLRVVVKEIKDAELGGSDHL